MDGSTKEAKKFPIQADTDLLFYFKVYLRLFVLFL